MTGAALTSTRTRASIWPVTVSSSGNGSLTERQEALREHFPGFRYIAPNPEVTIRPRGRIERVCAYRATTTIAPVHFHTMAELTLVLEGTGDLRIGGRRYPMRPGMLALAPSNVLHGQHSTPPTSKLVCMFDPGLVDATLAADPFTAQWRFVGERFAHAVDTGRAFKDVLSSFETLLDEHAHPDSPGGATMAATLLAQLLTHFLRAAVTRQLTGRRADAEDGRHADLMRVVDYVQQHFTEPINRASVAHALRMRPESISRLFQRGAGESFTSLLQRLRVGHAAELFESTSLSAADVRELSGFDSYRTFARVFRSTFGLSPTAYRDSLK